MEAVAKTCTVCRKEKPDDQFPFVTRRSVLRGTICTECYTVIFTTRSPERAQRVRHHVQKLEFNINIFNPNKRPNIREGWREQAACHGFKPNTFFPTPEDDPDLNAYPRSICARCPVRNDCLAYAIVSNKTDGIWGGTTSSEREPLRRQGVRWNECRCGRLYWRDGGGGIVCDGCRVKKSGVTR